MRTLESTWMECDWDDFKVCQYGLRCALYRGRLQTQVEDFGVIGILRHKSVPSLNGRICPIQSGLGKSFCLMTEQKNGKKEEEACSSSDGMKETKNEEDDAVLKMLAKRMDKA